MSVIENFAELSVKEQFDFAAALVKTLNSEKTFSSDVEFEVAGIEADDMTGGLAIILSHKDLIEVSRPAVWTCSDEDEAGHVPEDADFDNLKFEDAKKVFKTLAAEIEGYSISLEIDDVEEEHIVEVEVDKITDEDAGIGHYEFWGETGYDSQPYCEVTGTLVQECTIYCSLHVEAASHFEAEVEEE
jgi:hypothetical protein